MAMFNSYLDITRGYIIPNTLWGDGSIVPYWKYDQSNYLYPKPPPSKLGQLWHVGFATLLWHLVLFAVHRLWHPIPIGPPLSYCRCGTMPPLHPPHPLHPLPHQPLPPEPDNNGCRRFRLVIVTSFGDVRLAPSGQVGYSMGGQISEVHGVIMIQLSLAYIPMSAAKSSGFQFCISAT